MPTIEHDGASIYYEEHGSGFPILCFAPGGVTSTIRMWSSGSAPIDPAVDFAREFRVIVMDQRNAGGRSRAPITAKDGWHSFTADHVAVLDHLGIERCHLYGQCIGGPFILGMIQAQPQRVACAVIAQPIGRVGPMKPGRAAKFDDWAKKLEGHPEATEAVLDALYHNLYDAGFVYCVDREFVKRVKTPCMVLAGNDEAHPYPISEEVASLLPNCEFISEWKSGAALEAARPRVMHFLRAHTPVHA